MHVPTHSKEPTPTDETLLILLAQTGDRAALEQLLLRLHAPLRRYITRLAGADLADVAADPKLQSDHCPGYWWAEQMKYYYLLFSDTPRFDYRRNYLSTEGAVLQGFRRPG